MKKEEILEKSRKENRKRDIYEIEVEEKGLEYALVAMILLAFIYFTHEIAVGKGTNPALYSIITMFSAVTYTYKAIKLKKGRKLHIANAIIWAILTILLAVAYFNN